MKTAVVLSRRSVLGLATLALAGCKKGSSPTPRVDPDAGALGSARSSEAALIAACVAAGLTDQAVLHRQHLAALGGHEAVPTAPSTPEQHAIRSRLRDSTDALRGAAVAASDGTTAALLASIAASHQVIVDE